jgi:hypothetical protein
MRARAICLGSAVVMAWLQIVSDQISNPDLVFGQVYGSAGFLSSDPTGVMTDAPDTILTFTAENGHRTLLLTDKAGDYIALLEPGKYCVAAYTRAGKQLELGKNQLKCVSVGGSKDVRLDVMLMRNKK